MYHLTLFKNTFDNKTHRTFQYGTWDECVRVLRNASKDKGQKGGNNSSPLISPALYKPDSTRANDNVLVWGSWCCVDVDDFPFDDLKNQLQTLVGQYEFVCYSTASSRSDKPKFRLVFPLTRTVHRQDIPHFWYAFNKLLKGMGDEQTKDLSRMYYVPAEYPDAFNFFFTNSGRHVNPDDVMSAVPYEEKKFGKNFLDRLPDALRDEVIKYRKEKADNTSVTWTSYRDCKFFPKKLAAEYLTLSGTGWYHKMYQIMVATAANAIKNDYPITAKEIATLCRELDNETGKWYDKRPLEIEADRAIEYAYKNV